MSSVIVSGAGETSTADARGGLSPLAVAFLGGIAVAFGLLYFRWFDKQTRISIEHAQDWGHAFFIPLISGYLIWQRRAAISAARAETFWPGMLLVGFGIATYLTFSIGPNQGTHMSQGFAIVLSLLGIGLTLLGPGVMRHLYLPLVFLVFGVQISNTIMLKITWPMQLVASQGAYVLLGLVGSLAGYTVDVDGNVLTVTDAKGEAFPLNVAQACSGMRMVVAFLALGATVALLSCRLWWQRIAVSVLAVPVAVLMNVLRVTVLGLLTLGDRDLAQGEAHTLIGTLLLLPGLGTFLLIVWTLKKVVDVPDEAAPRGGVFAPRVLRPAPVVLLGLLIASAVGMTWAIGEYRYHLDKLPIYAPENRTLASLPKETDRWRAVGPDRIESAEMLEELGTLNYVTRTYTEKQPPAGRGPRTIELHATYYTDQIETVPHVPERCFVGGGLQQAAESRVLPLSLDRSAWIADPNAPEGEPAVQTARTSSRWSDGRGKRVRLPRGIETVGLRTSEYVLPFHGELYAGYFFVANGSVAANATEVLAMAYDLRDDYAYFMKVQFNGFKKGSIDSPEALAEASADLLGELLPDLMLCVPDWVEVTQGRYPADRGEARASR